MKKIALALSLVITLVSCSKKDDNKNVNVTRTFKGSTVNSLVNIEATTTVNSSDQSVGVKVTYTDNDGSSYIDSIKVIDVTGMIHSLAVELRTKGSVNNLSFSNLPLNKEYTCLFIRTGIAPYPDTLINIKGN